MRTCTMGSTQQGSKNRSFHDNGDQLLQELITLCNGKSSPMRVYTLKELEKVTASKNLIKRDGRFSLYKGTHDDRSITVKKYKNNNPRDVEECIKEIAITSYVNHKNVLKLLGCCLESHVPLQVHESVPNGSLSNHIYETGTHSSTNTQLLPWESRLRIATEIANAITYLHTATLRPIVHKNIKLGSILLDQNYVAKLSDFGYAVVIPSGETEIRMDVTGTVGVLPPEYLSTGVITEKSDVFSFGIFLLELLTGQRSYDLSRLAVDLDVMLIDHVRSHVEGSRLRAIVAPTILKEQQLIELQLQAFAELALRCTTMTPKERPAMMEAAKELSNIKSYVHS